MELSTTLIIVGVIILLIVGIILFVVLSPDEPQPTPAQQGWVTKQTTNIGETTIPDDKAGLFTKDITTKNNNVYAYGCNTAGEQYKVYNASQNNNPTEKINFIYDGVGLISCLTKYDENGQVIWSAKITGTDVIGADVASVGSFITTDLNENVYILGQFGDRETEIVFYDAIFNNSETPTQRWTLTRSGDDVNLFVAKYNKNGILQWTSKAATTTNQFTIGFGIACNDTDVYITGVFRATTDFFNGESGDPVTPAWSMTSIGSSDSFIAKYDLNGTLQWTTKIGSSSIDNGRGIVVTNSSVYFTGIYVDDFDIYNATNDDPTTIIATITNSNPGSAINSLVVKYNTNGELQWVNKITGDFAFNTTIALDTEENVYVIGQISDSNATLYDSKTGTPGVTPPGDWDPDVSRWDIVYGVSEIAYLAKYNSSGILQWTAKADNVEANSNAFTSVSTDSNNNVFVTLNFRLKQSTTLYDGKEGDPDVSRWNINSTEALGTASILKYSSDGILQWSTLLDGTDVALDNCVIDNNDNILACGLYFKDANIYEVNTTSGQPDTTPVIVYNDTESYQGIIIKYNPEGQIIV